MPSDGNFGFSVLVAGVPVKEYRHGGRVYVESDLWTPVSYKQRVRELAYGEMEEQEWPVTPYEIKIFTEPHCPQSWYEAYVDGVRVGKWALNGNETRLVKGFHVEEGVSEFLFALPRFARDENDKVDSSRKSHIGKIEVVRHAVTFKCKAERDRDFITFDQANKKDAHSVTGGKHTMSTTKKGRLISRVKPYELRHQKNIWHIGAELGRLTVEYHMKHTLQAMGINFKEPKQTASYSNSSKKED